MPEAEADELTTVMTFHSRAEADLAQEQLEGEGIGAFVMDDATAGIMPFVTGASGIRLQVPTDQVEKAREVLGLTGEPDTAPDGGPPAGSAN